MSFFSFFVVVVHLHYCAAHCSKMKIFALLGLASLVYADNDGNVVRRRRLALQKCSFPALRAGAHEGSESEGGGDGRCDGESESEDWG